MLFETRVGSQCFFKKICQDEGVTLSARLAIDRNFEPFSTLGAEVELLSVERESTSLCWSPLPEDQSIDHERMVVPPSPLDRVDPKGTFKSKLPGCSVLDR